MSVSVIFLCAGYGTRLEKDIKSCSKQEHVDLLGIPKGLLPIGGTPLISRWISLLAEYDYIRHFYVVTNNRFYNQFASWGKNFPTVSIINDGTNCNEDRMGAVASMGFAISQFHLENQDVLIIGGDTLMYSDFIIQDYMSHFFAKKKTIAEYGLLTTYNCKDAETSKHGIVEVDEETGLVEQFLEKPAPNATRSRFACPCFYLLSPGCTKLITEFLKEKKEAPLEEKDAAGHFVKYLIPRCKIFQYSISGRFDVGGLESYKQCDSYFSK